MAECSESTGRMRDVALLRPRGSAASRRRRAIPCSPARASCPRDRREDRRQARRADDGGEDDVDVVALRPARPGRPGRGRPSRPSRSISRTDASSASSATAQRRRGGGVSPVRASFSSCDARRQRDRAVFAAEMLDHVQRVAPDGAGGAEDGDPFGQARDIASACMLTPLSWLGRLARAIERSGRLAARRSSRGPVHPHLPERMPEQSLSAIRGSPATDA